MTNWQKFFNEALTLAVFIPCSLLTLVFAIVLGRVLCGTQYKVLLWMVVLLLLYNVLYVLGSVAL